MARLLGREDPAADEREPGRVAVDLTVEEVAEAMDCSASTVRGWCHSGAVLVDCHI